MATLPSGWRGQLLAGLLTLVALIGVYILAAVPLLDFYADRQTKVQMQRSLLLHLNARASELPALRARVTQLRAEANHHKLVLEGTSDAVASAVLQGHTEELAAATGVAIGSTEILSTNVQGAHHRIGLRLALSGRYESLTNLLARLETATPPLVVDNLQIHSLQHRPGATPATEFNASLEVYGFRTPETTSTAKP
jgi:general secretion pathway protein M